MSQLKNITSRGVAVHVLIWLFLLLFPFLLSSGESYDVVRIIRFTLVPVFFHAIIFYANYLLFIERFLFSKKTLIFVTANIILVFVTAGIVFSIQTYIGTLYRIERPASMPAPTARFTFYKDVISMLIPVIISIAARTTEKWSANEAERKEIEKESLHSELLHLKYQLQPHFFFNSLNTIYSLVERSPELAQETIHSLSKLMRYMLYQTDKDKNSLAEEVEFMTQYINLMKLRISDKTRINMNFEKLEGNHVVTPLLFISLLENAFKHGVSSNQPTEICFTLEACNNKIKFYAQNTNFPKTNTDKSGSGLGLTNLQKRLQLCYPNRHLLQTGVENGQFIVRMELEMDGVKSN